MAASVTSEDFIHRIGPKSTYDIDMDFIEDLVRAFRYPYNEIYQYTLYSYYIYKANSYFTTVEEYIISDQPEKDLKTGIFSLYIYKYNTKTSLEIENHFKEIRDNFKTSITQRFNELMSNTETNYLTTKVVNPVDFMEIFYFISLIFCMASLNKILKSNYIDDFINKNYILMKNIHKMYPLTNNTGIFDINCYMYALFSGVYLIGVPNKATYADGVFGCPVFFLEHDIIHTSGELLRDKDDDIENFRKLYVAILSEETFTQEEKELHILIMWYIIHETTVNFSIYNFFYNSFIKKKYNYNDIDIKLEDYPALELINDLFTEFERFSKFTLKDSNITLFLYKNKIEMNIDITKKYGLDISEYNEEDFSKILELPYEKFKEPIGYLLFYASFIFSVNQISSKFSEFFVIEEEDEY
jgi:hypothetical protein